MNDAEALSCVEELWEAHCRTLREEEERRAEVEGRCMSWGEVSMK